MSGRTSSRAGVGLNCPGHFFIIDLHPVGETDLGSNAPGRAGNAQLLAADFSRIATTSPALHWYEANVDRLAVHRDRPCG